MLSQRGARLSNSAAWLPVPRGAPSSGPLPGLLAFPCLVWAHAIVSFNQVASALQAGHPVLPPWLSCLVRP